MFVKDALKRGCSGPFACSEGHLTAWIIHKLCTPTALRFRPPRCLSRNNPFLLLRPHTSIKCGQIHKKMHVELLKRPNPVWFAAPASTQQLWPQWRQKCWIHWTFCQTFHKPRCICQHVGRSQNQTDPLRSCRLFLRIFLCEGWSSTASLALKVTLNQSCMNDLDYFKGCCWSSSWRRMIWEDVHTGITCYIGRKPFMEVEAAVSWWNKTLIFTFFNPWQWDWKLIITTPLPLTANFNPADVEILNRDH